MHAIEPYTGAAKLVSWDLWAFTNMIIGQFSDQNIPEAWSFKLQKFILSAFLKVLKICSAALMLGICQVYIEDNCEMSFSFYFDSWFTFKSFSLQ